MLNVITKEVFDEILHSEVFTFNQMYQMLENKEKYGTAVRNIPNGLAAKNARIPNLFYSSVIGNHDSSLLDEIDEITDWYFEDSDRFAVRIIPMNENLELIKGLRERGFKIQLFNNYAIRELPSYRLQSAFQDHIYKIRDVNDNNFDEFIDVLIRAYEAEGITAEFLRDFSKMMQKYSKAFNFLCYENNKPIGTGSIIIDGKVAQFLGGGVLKEYRGKRIQQMLIDHRLLLAQEHGVRYTTSITKGYNTSFRNLERNKFRLAFNLNYYVKSKG